ncbi:MAG: diaminopropionate ammonia-lyase [Phycisphaerales bacterium]
MTSALLNPALDASRAARFDPPPTEPREFHDRLPDAAPTPLREAVMLRDRLNLGAVLVKDESWRFGLPAFKALGASWAVYRLLEQARGRPFEYWTSLGALRAQIAALGPRTLITATDGNHGRGVARVARWFGFEAIVYMPRDTAASRVRAIESEGATVDVIEGDYDEAVRRASAIASELDDAWLVQDTAFDGYREIPAWIVDGYSTMFHEIDDELRARNEAPPDLVIVQVGVGSLAMAALRHFKSRERDGAAPVVLSVEPGPLGCALESIRRGEATSTPDPQSIMAGMNCGTLSIDAWPLLRDGLDGCLSIDDDRAREGMRHLAQDGVVSGETGAAGAGALFALVESDEAAPLREAFAIGPETRALILSTEGATDPESYRAIVGAVPR